VRALVEGAPAEARDFVEPWMNMARSVLHTRPPGAEGAALLSHCETEIVRLTLANLVTFPWIKDAVESGRLALHGFQFDIHTGALGRLGAGGFVPVR
jgi:carbonic anhydrase